LANIILNDPERGVQLINLRVPFGTPLGETTLDRETLNRVVKTGKPFIPPLLQCRVSGRYATAIVVPVRSACRTYTLVGIIKSAAWLNFLSSYPIAPNATMTLLDQNGLVIARSLNNDKWVGHRVSPGLYRESRKSPEGAYKNVGLEVQMFYSAHSRLKISDLTTATGVPSETVEAVLWKSDLTIGSALIIVASAADAKWLQVKSATRADSQKKHSVGAKGLELLKEILPKLARLAVVETSTNPGNVLAFNITDSRIISYSWIVHEPRVNTNKDCIWDAKMAKPEFS
jgi:hypothetical protein